MLTVLLSLLEKLRKHTSISPELPAVLCAIINIQTFVYDAFFLFTIQKRVHAHVEGFQYESPFNHDKKSELTIKTYAYTLGLWLLY